MSVHDRPTDRGDGAGGQDKDYEESDVRHLLKVRPWRSYDEMISWLRREGDADSRLTTSEVGHLVNDLSRLQHRKAALITDSTRLYHELKR
jgi:hypothetical protein